MKKDLLKYYTESKKATGEKPSENDIKELIDDIKSRLDIRQINMNKNFALKEGLTDCLRILNDRLKNPENKWYKAETEAQIDEVDKIYRDQQKGIDKLKTIKGRSIAVLCIDYLNGNASKEAILNLEIKMR